LRPIAVGLTLRRLTSKVSNRWVSERLLPVLTPRQLGVGVRGRAERIVHAARTYLASSSPWHALVKLDFMNVFISYVVTPFLRPYPNMSQIYCLLFSQLMMNRHFFCLVNLDWLR